MLDALLKHFRSYGMEDLEFIIVNSKLSHSQDKLEELKKRVSFEVYQETDEEEVWSVMEGGKDDMYVYDRCGRLTYYIPFPLSILNESPLVSNAILATYFRSPCGVNCDQNKTLEFDDVVKNIEEDYDTTNVYEEGNSTYTETEQPIIDNVTTTDAMEFSNDVLYITTPEYNETDTFNLNDNHNDTDYAYPTFDNSLQLNETNTTDVEQARSFFDNIYKLFFNANSDGTMIENVHIDSNVNETSFEENTLHNVLHNDTEITDAHVHHMDHVHHGHHKHEHKTNTHGEKKSNRCLEADYEVCKSWSKKRLLHAQKCCSEAKSAGHRSCHNFGKKRCKKMQSILKCCIKTVYAEHATTVPSDEESATLTTTPTEVPTTQVATEHKMTTDVPNIVCCKTVNEAKLCRVSNAETCEQGEYIERSPSQNN